MWTPILTHSEQETTQEIKTGVLIDVSDMTPTATVLLHDTYNQIVVDFPEINRQPHVANVIRTCVSFRIEVDIIDCIIVAHRLCVNEYMFLNEVTSGCTGEMYLIAYVSYCVNFARIPFKTSIFEHSDNSINDSTFSRLTIQDDSPETMRRGLKIPRLSSKQDISSHGTHYEYLWNQEYPLHDHQKKSVRWMRLCEKDASRYLQYSQFIPIADTGWYIDVRREILGCNFNFMHEIQVFGGILNDGTGMGKTASILRLIAESKNECFTPFSPFSDHLYVTKATLIIVPINLPMQWISEIAKFTNDLNVIRLILGKDLKNLSLQNLMEADIVLTTFAFIRGSKPYTDLFEKMWTTGGDTIDKKWSNRNRSSVSAWARLPNQTLPILEAIHWRRLVIDEMHETFDSARDMKLLRQFHCHLMWGMTATLNMTYDRMKPIVQFLTHEHVSSHHPCKSHTVLSSQIKGTPSPYKWKNYLHLVPMTESEHKELVHFVSATAQTLDIIRVCNNLKQNVDPMTFPPTQVIYGHQNDLDNIESQCAELVSQLIQSYVSVLVLWNVQQIVEDNVYFEDKLSASSISRLHKVFCETIRNMKKKECRLNIVHTNLQRIANEETCSICMHSISNSITSCGHIFCYDCINRHLDINNTCPACRHGPLKKEDDVRLVTSNDSSGGKVWSLVKMVCSLKERVIIFAQWKDLIRLIRSALRSANIKPHILEGTTMQRANVIEQFVSDVSGVLLICIQDSFAGLHLPYAKHIIFAHAFVGEIGRVKTWETQAVSRTIRPGCSDDVQVHSFVLAETEEERIWRMTHSAQLLKK